jgi:hypothetical protein
LLISIAPHQQGDEQRKGAYSHKHGDQADETSHVYRAELKACYRASILASYAQKQAGFLECRRETAAQSSAGKL